MASLHLPAQLSAAMRQLLLLTSAIVGALATIDGRAAEIYANADGDWNNPATWLPSVVPDAADVVHIMGHSIRLTTSQAAAGVQILGGSTLDLNGHDLSMTGPLTLDPVGGRVTVFKSGGHVKTSGVRVGSGVTYSIGSGDAVTQWISVENGTLAINAPLTLAYDYHQLGGVVTTSDALTVLNTTGARDVFCFVVERGTFNAGGDVTVSRGPPLPEATSLDVKVESGGVFNLNGHKLTSWNLTLFGHNGGATFNKGGGTLDLHRLGLNEASLSIEGDDNVSESVQVIGNGSVLDIHKPLHVANHFELYSGGVANIFGDLESFSVKVDGSGLNLNGNNLTGNSFAVISNVQPARVDRGGAGQLNFESVFVGMTSSLDFLPGDVAHKQLWVAQGSQATMIQSVGATTGLTLDGISVGSLSVDGSSQLSLAFDAASAPGDWAFRWANPPNGNHIADIQSLHSDGRVLWNMADRVSLTDGGDGYTYVAIAVPEPSAWTAIVVAALLVGVWLRRPSASDESRTVS